MLFYSFFFHNHYKSQTSDSLTQLNAVVNSGEGEEAITLSRETIENVNDSSLSLKNNEEEGKESQGI